MSGTYNKLKFMWQRLMFGERFCVVAITIAIVCTLINVGLCLLGYKWPQ